MSIGTKIEWTHRPGTVPATMNALVGCQKVSEGCRHCYAKNLAYRFSKSEGSKFFGTAILQNGEPNWTGRINLDEKALLAPLRKTKPHTYFVNSLSDLFADGVPDEWIDRHFAVFSLCPQHTFIVLTKRPERQRAYLSERPQAVWHRKALDIDLKALPMLTAQPWPLPNVWLGVSVEDQKAANKRIPELLQTPAAVRFLSCEPLLGPVDLLHVDWVEEMKRDYTAKHAQVRGTQFEETLSHLLQDVSNCQWEEGRAWRNVLTGAWFDGWDGDDTPEPEHTCIDWVIAGGESGPKARPMHPDWARSLRDQCAAAGVPFFFKQWGEWAPLGEVSGNSLGLYSSVDKRCQVVAANGRKLGRPWGGWSLQHPGALVFFRVGKKTAGHLLDGVEHHAFPEVSCQR